MKMDIVQIARDSGIVGAGGAGFPSHVKLSAKAEYVILNGAECEPLLRVDQQLLMVYADQIIIGLEEVVKHTKAKKAFIGVKEKHKEVVDILNKKLKGNKKIEVFSLKDFYPAGDEQYLVNEVTMRVVPEGGIPLNVGCIVLNVETVLNLVNATNGNPVTHTYLTITGKVPKPITISIPIGVSVREALILAGVENFNGIKVIDGGPMMGRILSDLDVPIIKTTKGLIVLDEEHYLIRKKGMTIDMAMHQSKASCEQCRMCTDLCPRNLLGNNIKPHLMMRRSNFDRGESLEGAETAALCSECAVCELYACPVGLSPRLIIKNYKQKMVENAMKYVTTKTEFTTSEVKDYRKIPVKRLILRLGIKEYDVPAPLKDITYKPKLVKIPLKQHVGAPSVPVVEVGQTVHAGQLIGEIPENALGAKIHSSIHGKVTEISECIVIESV